MKWLEIIQLRSSTMNRGSLEQLLATWISEDAKYDAAQTIKVFKHATVETDYSIHIEYDTDKSICDASELGVKMTTVLKEFGLVNHNIWIEKQSWR